jgi:hypothetical protein
MLSKQQTPIIALLIIHGINIGRGEEELLRWQTHNCCVVDDDDDDNGNDNDDSEGS